MLAGLDEATSEAEIRPPQPEGEVFELTDEMALPASPPQPVVSRRSSRKTISNSLKPPPGRRAGSPRSSRRRLKAPLAADPVALDRIGS